MLKHLFGATIWYDGVLFSSGEAYNVLMLLATVLVIAAAAYLLGNVNTAILITRLVYKEDIRTKGSGNPGMTNVMRNYGWLPALFTLLGDMFKCMLAMVV
jgi:glycerol-3-phosphate acyltransferase PlsY